jgi:hypothetical protein
LPHHHVTLPACSWHQLHPCRAARAGPEVLQLPTLMSAVGGAVLEHWRLASGTNCQTRSARVYVASANPGGNRDYPRYVCRRARAGQTEQMWAELAACAAHDSPWCWLTAAQ